VRVDLEDDDVSHLEPPEHKYHRALARHCRAVGQSVLGNCKLPVWLSFSDNARCVQLSKDVRLFGNWGFRPPSSSLPATKQSHVMRASPQRGSFSGSCDGCFAHPPQPGKCSGLS
jgi:hypothetical protein